MLLMTTPDVGKRRQTETIRCEPGYVSAQDFSHRWLPHQHSRHSVSNMQTQTWQQHYLASSDSYSGCWSKHHFVITYTLSLRGPVGLRPKYGVSDQCSTSPPMYDYTAAFSFKWAPHLAELYAGYPGILHWNTQETGSERGKAGKAAMFAINWPYLPFAPGATWKKKKSLWPTSSDSPVIHCTGWLF